MWTIWPLNVGLCRVKCIEISLLFPMHIILYWCGIFVLTVIGLTPGCSSAVQYTFTHKQYTEQHNET
jgi:hypothetical protein